MTIKELADLFKIKLQQINVALFLKSFLKRYNTGFIQYTFLMLGDFIILLSSGFYDDGQRQIRRTFKRMLC